jgi:hypothetical protein
MATLFDNVDVTVECAFGDTPLDTTPTWTDISADVIRVSISRGRTSEFSTYSPGVATITLDNSDRTYDPEYTSGPYYGDLNPMVQMRVTAQYSTGTVHSIYRGFVQGWPTAYNMSGTQATTAVVCIDANRVLANMALPANDFVNYMIDTQVENYIPLQTADKIQPSYIGGTSASGGTLDDYPTQQVIPVGDLGVGTRATMSQAGRFTNLDSPNGLSFWLYNPGGNPINVDVYATGLGVPFSYQKYLLLRIINNRVYVRWSNGSTFGVTGGTPYYDTGYDLDQSVSVQHIGLWLSKLYVNAVEVDSWSTGVLADSYVSPQGVEIDCGSSSFVAHVWVTDVGTVGAFETSLDEQYTQGVAPYAGELSSARLTRALDDAGWPATWRDIATGDQAVGNYTPGAEAPIYYNVQIDSAEQGSLFVNREGDVEFRSRTTANTANIVALFDDADIDLPYNGIQVDAHTIDAIRNNVIVAYAYGTTTSTDATSVTNYGLATQNLNAQLIDHPDDAKSIGDNFLARTKDPRTRITQLDANLRTDPATMVNVIAPLDLSDDVSVSIQPPGGGDELWRAVRVQGIAHSIGPKSWDVSLYLAPGPINTNGPLLVLNDANYGKLDSGNKLG